MFALNRTVIGGIAVGIAGSLFIGYCIYFDSKRRSDPEYKKKVAERRRREQKMASEAMMESGTPNLNDHEAIERYFLQEIHKGEELISREEYDCGVEHLANAIIVCGQPGRLLNVLQDSLPSEVFAMLIIKMQELGNRAAAADASDGTDENDGNNSFETNDENDTNDDEQPKPISSKAEVEDISYIDMKNSTAKFIIDDPE